MALESKDTSADKTVEERPVQILVKRTNGDGAGIEFIVTFEREVDGVTTRYMKRVPKDVVDAAWASDTKRTLKNTILAIIDNAE